MSLKYKIIFPLFVVLLTACAHSVPEPTLLPEKTSLEPVIQKAQTPTRAASMRLVDQGRKELNQSRFEKAAAQFSHAVEIDASNPYAYFYLALTRMQTKKFAQASDFFRRASDLFSDSLQWRSESLAYAGECYEQNHQWFDAQHAFMKSLDVDGGNVRAKAGLERVDH